MQVVIDSNEFKKLQDRVEALQEYAEAGDDYSSGSRDGYNAAVVQIVEMLKTFWTDVTA